MQRKQMIDDLNRKLKEWDERLTATEEKLEAKTDEAKARLEQRRARAKERRAELKSRLDSAVANAGDGWERTAGELEDAWKEFQNAAKDVYESVRS